MSKPKKQKEQVITIDGIDYKFDDMTENGKMFVNQVADLDNKIFSATHNLKQLEGGRTYFWDLLCTELGHEPPTETVTPEVAG